MSDLFAGIDPGRTGAIAFIGSDGYMVVSDMPYVGSELDIAALRELIGGQGKLDRAALEFQQSMPKQGVASVFTLGVSYGALKAFLVCMEVPYDTPKPLAWKKALGIPAGSDKEVSRAKALQMFPLAAPYLKRKMDHGRAEALLIAEYCRRSYYGQHGKEN